MRFSRIVVVAVVALLGMIQTGNAEQKDVCGDASELLMQGGKYQIVWLFTPMNAFVYFGQNGARLGNEGAWMTPEQMRATQAALADIRAGVAANRKIRITFDSATRSVSMLSVLWNRACPGPRH